MKFAKRIFTSFLVLNTPPDVRKNYYFPSRASSLLSFLFSNYIILYKFEEQTSKPGGTEAIYNRAEISSPKNTRLSKDSVRLNATLALSLALSLSLGATNRLF